MNQINRIGPLGEVSPVPAHTGVRSTGKPQVSFGETLQGFMKDVNEMQNKAGESIEKMMAGEITDVHQVMNSVQEADVAFNMMMEIRNKVLEAYKEVMRMRL